MNEIGDSFEQELERIKKTLGLDTKSELRAEIDEFLGRTNSTRKSKTRVSRYEPFFPFDALSFYRHISEGYSSPDRELEKSLVENFQRSQVGSPERLEALNQIMKAFIRLVIHRSRQFTKSGVEQEDIVQEAIFGLIRASEKADMDLGNRFSTYAGSWIDQTASRYVGNHSRQVRIPINGHEAIRKAKAIRRSDFLHGRPARSLEKIEAELEISAGSLRKLLEADNLVLSLDEWRKKNDKVDSFDLQSHIEDIEFKRDLEIALDFLHPREAGVLRSRFGIYSGVEMTLEEVGEKFGVTRERIRQLEKKALDKLRNGPYSEKLRSHAGLFSSPVTHQTKMRLLGMSVAPAPEKKVKRKRGPSNQERSLEAGARIVSKVSEALSSLGQRAPLEQREAGELRILHPELSLSDLGKLSNPPISKDAFAGRLRRLLDSAEDIHEPILETHEGTEDMVNHHKEEGPRLDLGLSTEFWLEIVRKTELALLIAGGKLSASERESSNWVLEMSNRPMEDVVKAAGGASELKALLENLKFLIGNPWSDNKPST